MNGYILHPWNPEAQSLFSKYNKYLSPNCSYDWPGVIRCVYFWISTPCQISLLFFCPLHPPYTNLFNTTTMPFFPSNFKQTLQIKYPPFLLSHCILVPKWAWLCLAEAFKVLRAWMRPGIIVSARETGQPCCALLPLSNIFPPPPGCMVCPCSAGTPTPDNSLHDGDLPIWFVTAEDEKW